MISLHIIAKCLIGLGTHQCVALGRPNNPIFWHTRTYSPHLNRRIARSSCLPAFLSSPAPIPSLNPKGILEPAAHATFFGFTIAGIVAHGLLKFLEQPPLLIVQFGRHNDFGNHYLIAATVAA